LRRLEKNASELRDRKRGPASTFEADKCGRLWKNEIESTYGADEKKSPVLQNSVQ
jgi:hypothetical protein